MTEVSARIVLDSLSPYYPYTRLTTVEVKIHRFILAEANTHRDLSRLSASSRAIPVEKQLRRFVDDPANPVSWPCEQPGMSGGNQLEGQDLVDAQDLFWTVRTGTAHAVRDYLAAHPDKSTRLHKSVINRLMEWGQWHTVLISSTKWKNFFKLRIAPDAQPEFRAAAIAIKEAMDESQPVPRFVHVPFVDPEMVGGSLFNPDGTVKDIVKESVAHCARTSNEMHFADRSVEDNLRLFGDLYVAGHWSPYEMVAVALEDSTLEANFHGWTQLRALLGGRNEEMA